MTAVRAYKGNKGNFKIKSAVTCRSYDSYCSLYQT